LGPKDHADVDEMGLVCGRKNKRGGGARTGFLRPAVRKGARPLTQTVMSGGQGGGGARTAFRHQPQPGFHLGDCRCSGPRGLSFAPQKGGN